MRGSWFPEEENCLPSGSGSQRNQQATSEGERAGSCPGSFFLA